MVKIDGLRCHIELPFVTDRVSIERRKILTEFGNVASYMCCAYASSVSSNQVGGLPKENTRRKYKAPDRLYRGNVVLHST